MSKLSKKYINKYKFCASCFNYVDSCDCLGNLEDHQHINDFERPGKDDDDPDDDNVVTDVWYFRAQIGPTLDQFGSIGLAGALAIPDMWTRDPPADPTKYLSIPVDRFPMPPVNRGGSVFGGVDMVAPKQPWEIPFFGLRNLPDFPQKTDAQIAEELRKCLKAAAKKKFKRIKMAACTAKAAVQYAQSHSTYSYDDMIADVKAQFPSVVKGFYVAAPLVSQVVPPKLWKLADQAVVPGCGFQWIEMQLIDGSDPALSLDCTDKFSNAVDGVEDFWNDNQSGGGKTSDIYGDLADPITQPRMLMMPFVPPPVKPPKIDDPLDPPVPYDPPPIVTPPTVTQPPSVVQPPVDPPITGTPYNERPNHPIFACMIQVSELGIDFPLAIINNQAPPGDYRRLPFLSWGAAAGARPNNGDTMTNVPLYLKTTNRHQAGDFVLFRWYYITTTTPASKSVRFQCKLKRIAGDSWMKVILQRKISGVYTNVFTGSSQGTGAEMFLAFDVTVPAGTGHIECAWYFPDVNTQGLTWELFPTTSWDPDVLPIYTWPSLSGWTQAFPSPAPQFEPAVNPTNGVLSYDNKNRDTIVTCARAVAVKPFSCMLCSGEVSMTNNRFFTNAGVPRVFKCDGAGGLSPITDMGDPNNFNPGFTMKAKQGSDGSWSAAIISWTK